MEYKAYPALFRASDSASMKAQSTYMKAIKAHIAFMVVGAALTINPLPNTEYSVFNAFIFLCALSISILIASRKYERGWYSGRAVAESVKTASWRYMMKAEPFANSKKKKQTNSLFRETLDEILKTNNQLGDLLGGALSAEEQITQEMEKTRAQDFNNRKAFYLRHRIDEQREWYAKKSEENQRKGNRFFYLLILLQSLAIICVLSRVAFHDWALWPTEVFVVGAGGVVTWTQLKRFQELSAAYGLTAHEIGLIKGKLADADTEQEFSEFVRDAENAFSREHTQWAAKQAY